jgi:hypothetical protein
MPVRPPDSGNSFGDYENAGWRSCIVCGTAEFKGIVYFDSGSVEPAAGETVTGATSGDTGVIEAVYLRSGTYAGGDAAGCLELTSATGYERENWTMFQDNEALNGSTSGDDFSTVAGIGSVVVNGVLYPQDDMIEYQGQWYCRPHFEWRFGYEWKTEEIHKTGEESKRSYD